MIYQAKDNTEFNKVLEQAESGDTIITNYVDTITPSLDISELTGIFEILDKKKLILMVHNEFNQESAMKLDYYNYDYAKAKAILSNICIIKNMVKQGVI